MNESGESYGRVVPEKPPNKVARATAEVEEERRPAKGNTVSKTCAGPRAGASTPSELARVRQVAERDKDARFTALLHHRVRTMASCCSSSYSSSNRCVLTRPPREPYVSIGPPPCASDRLRAWTSAVECGSMDRPGWFGWWRFKH
jgi:hypothetical protein